MQTRPRTLLAAALLAAVPLISHATPTPGQDPRDNDPSDPAPKTAPKSPSIPGAPVLPPHGPTVPAFTFSNQRPRLVVLMHGVTPKPTEDANVATAGVKTSKISLKDVNGDGIRDMLLEFKTQALVNAGLLADAKTLYVTGRTSDGILVVGSDVIYLSSGPTCR